MPLRRVCTPVDQLQPFERARIVGLLGARWTYRPIAAHVGNSVSVVVAAFSSGLWNIPTPVDRVLDGRVALCKLRWPPEQHPENKFRQCCT